jgi:hypothetical protein
MGAFILLSNISFVVDQEEGEKVIEKKIIGSKKFKPTRVQFPKATKMFNAV